MSELLLRNSPDGSGLLVWKCINQGRICGDKVEVWYVQDRVKQ